MAVLRDHVRALLLSVHLVAVTAMALPVPVGSMNEARWRTAHARAQGEAWGRIVRALGWNLTDSEVLDIGFAAGKAAVRVRNRALRPFRPYYDWCGTEQSWRMFGLVNRTPAFLQVDIEETEAIWRTVHVSRSMQHDWLATKLDHERFRTAVNEWGRGHDRSTWRSFVGWLARNAAADFPRATRLRAVLVRWRTPGPAQVRKGRRAIGTPRWDLVVPVPRETEP